MVLADPVQAAQALLEASPGRQPDGGDRRGYRT